MTIAHPYKNKDVEKVIGIDFKVIRGWMIEGYLRVGIQKKGRPKWERVYSKHDIFKIALFAVMVSVGASKENAGNSVDNPATFRRNDLVLVAPFAKTFINVLGLISQANKRIRGVI